MTITKKEAIRRHRLMWNWIAQTSIQEQRCVSKFEAFKHFEWSLDTKSWCWCCEYSLMDGFFNAVHCTLCPIQWGKDAFGRQIVCLDFNSLFIDWTIADQRNDYIKFAKYAYQIAELPERKD